MKGRPKCRDNATFSNFSGVVQSVITAFVNEAKSIARLVIRQKGKMYWPILQLVKLASQRTAKQCTAFLEQENRYHDSKRL